MSNDYDKTDLFEADSKIGKAINELCKLFEEEKVPFTLIAAPYFKDNTHGMSMHYWVNEGELTPLNIQVAIEVCQCPREVLEIMEGIIALNYQLNIKAQNIASQLLQQLKQTNEKKIIVPEAGGKQ